MTTPTAVARAVAKDAEQRARTALDDVLTAHTQLRQADTAITAATQAKATAGPALARAIDSARAAGITAEQLTDLGITVPSARTRRRTTRAATEPAGVATAPDHPRPPTQATAGHDQPPAPATTW